MFICLFLKELSPFMVISPGSGSTELLMSATLEEYLSYNVHLNLHFLNNLKMLNSFSKA